MKENYAVYESYIDQGLTNGLMQVKVVCPLPVCAKAAPVCKRCVIEFLVLRGGGSWISKILNSKFKFDLRVEDEN